MKNKSKNKSDDKYHIRDSETISMKASTGMDCTGLIPSLPETESQMCIRDRPPLIAKHVMQQLYNVCFFLQH